MRQRPKQMARLKACHDTNQGAAKAGLFTIALGLGSSFKTVSGVAHSLRIILAELAHYGGVFGFDFVDHADFAGLTVGIFIDTEIFFGHLVDVGAGAFFSDFDDAAANFQIAVGIFGIDQCEGDAGIAANVFIFLASFGGIEDDVFAVVIDPDGGDLRAAIGHERAKAGEGAFGEQITIFFGDSF